MLGVQVNVSRLIKFFVLEMKVSELQSTLTKWEKDQVTMLKKEENKEVIKRTKQEKTRLNDVISAAEKALRPFTDALKKCARVPRYR